MDNTQNKGFQPNPSKQPQSGGISPDNPLKQYFRQYSMWIPLPSKEMGHYPPDIMELNDDGELGIMPMTSNDEIMIKNPDALLNGEAMRHVLKSCCPQIKDPDRIILNDVEAIMVAIRAASYGKEMELHAKCPKCGEENDLSLNLEEVLQSMDYLNSEHTVIINDGNGETLRVHMVPYLYHSYLQLNKQTFEEEKILRALERMSEKDDSIDESKKIEKMSEAYKRMAHLSFRLMADCVVKVTSESNEDMVVEDRKFIYEFIENISRENAKKISNSLDASTKAGVRKLYDVKCKKCEHEWEERISFDPASFF